MHSSVTCLFLPWMQFWNLSISHNQSIWTISVHTDGVGTSAWKAGDLFSSLACDTVRSFSNVTVQYLHVCFTLYKRTCVSECLNVFSKGFKCIEILIAGEKPRENMSVCDREREKMCGYQSVIMNVQTMCRHVSVSAWVCACEWEHVWDYVVNSAIWSAFAHGIKTIGLRRWLFS